MASPLPFFLLLLAILVLISPGFAIVLPHIRQPLPPPLPPIQLLYIPPQSPPPPATAKDGSHEPFHALKSNSSVSKKNNFGQSFKAAIYVTTVSDFAARMCAPLLTLLYVCRYNLLDLVDHFHQRGLYRSTFLSIMEGEQSLRKFSPEVKVLDSSFKDAILLLPPIILFHGSDDRSIPSESSKKFADALTKVGARTELVLYDGKTHTDLFVQVSDE
ncbi:uncharacterized protein LOC114712499 [Neltuma alba]|uniref:uncharacterized protein LOC114712499 n=1 Tax=Neltuma alba TaxID=207710 RepID=UPI0010A540C4|nr:uncharacterized protein LOC114712499 [Prosopis alba]